MRPKHLSATAVIAVLATGIGLALVGPANAADPTTLYVSTTNCSDAGTGTPTQPFCSIGAAAAVVLPGQTVVIAGTHHEKVTITRSGTSAAPITFQAASGLTGFLAGSGSGIVIDGQHDVVISKMDVIGGDGIAVNASSNITLTGNTVAGAGTVSPGVFDAAVRLTGVTDSTLLGNTIGPFTTFPGNAGDGISLDASTHGVTLRSNTVRDSGLSQPAGAGIDVSGSSNTIVDNTVRDNLNAGIKIEAGAQGNVLADNILRANQHGGIDNFGAATAITNNTLTLSCVVGIAVESAATQTSVQNNIVVQGQPGLNPCNPSPSPVAIGVFGAATTTTTIDYNVVDPFPPFVAYGWGSATQATVAAFQQVSGQGTHDTLADPQLVINQYMPVYLSPAVDSANSAAPGYQATDETGGVRVDNPNVVNTGAGPIAYADRGAVELRPGLFGLSVGHTTPALVTGQPNPTWTVTFAANPTVLSGPVASYTFDFGDGTPSVTQASATATHLYAATGNWQVTVTATDAGGSTAAAADTVQLARPALTVSAQGGQFLTGNSIEVGVSTDNTGLGKTRTYRFDFGDGTVATTEASTSPAAGAAYAYPKSGTYTLSVTVTDSTGLALTTSQPVTIELNPGGPPPVFGLYTALGPVRVLDTRNAIGIPTTTAIQPKQTIELSIGGANGVPSSGVTAIVLTVTVTQPTASGYLTAYPSGSSLPNSSNINWTAGQTIPNLVVLPVTNGKVELYNGSTGTVHLIADLAGYYHDSTGAITDVPGSTFAPVLQPFRVLDTRDATGVPGSTAVAAGQTITVPLLTAPGFPSNIPVSDLTAVTLNVTATQTTKSGYLTVFPSGTPRPTASNLNWAAGQTVPNLVVVPVVDGKVNFYNGSTGTVHLIADVQGYYTTGQADEGYKAVGPVRILDTRSKIGVPTTTPIAPHSSITVQIAGNNGVPSFGVAATILNVTVIAPTASGYLALDSAAVTLGSASNLNWSAGQTIANMAVVNVDGNTGRIQIFNGSSGTVHVVIDELGYFIAE